MTNEISIKKRDGRVETFNSAKIENAILNCYNKNDFDQINLQKIFKNISDHIINLKKEVVDVEEIQNIVVENINEYDKEAGESYQSYREERAKARDLRTNSKKYETFFDIVSGKENDVTRENSNKDAKVIYTKRDLFAGMQSRELWEKFMVGEKALKYHKEGIIHIHDTDYRAMKTITNCSIFNLKDMLDNGTVINGKKINTPKSLRTATTIATQIVMGIGNMQYGGITMSLAHLAPYVEKSRQKHRERNRNILNGAKWRQLLKKYKLDTLWYSFKKNVDGYNAKLDKLTEDDLAIEIKDAMQTLQYQLNSMTANSGQSPFITIWMDLNEDDEHREDTALLIDELLKQRRSGMYNEHGHNISPAFPKLIYVLDENNYTKGTEYFYLTERAADCTANRMMPDYISAKVMRSIKDGGLTPCMGCRSMVSPWYDENGEYKTWGRFNIGVMTVNLPLIALQTKTERDFFDKLQDMMDIIKEEQLKVAEDLAEASSDVAPMLWNYGAFARLPKGAKLRELIYGGYATASIGYAGVAEAVARFGYDYLTPKGQQFGLKIVKFMDAYCDKLKEETNLGFSLYGTPLESTVQKFANALKEYPIMENVNDRDYITNSYHVPVHQEINAFSKLKFEAPFQEYSAGGAISYIEVPDISKNVPAVLNVLEFMYNNIMYAEINTRNNDVCYECGYNGEIENYAPLKWKCPHCGNEDKNKMYVMRRTCGYAGSNFWNDTREAEIRARVTHL